MADISTYLRKIKTAVRGADVRDSIHDSIKKINDNVTKCTDEHARLKDSIDDLKRKVQATVQEISEDLAGELREKLRGIEDRFAEIDHNLETLENEIRDKYNRVLYELTLEIDRLKADTLDYLAEVDARFEEFNETLATLDQEISSRFEEFNEALATLDQEISRLDQDISRLRTELEDAISETKAELTDLIIEVNEALKFDTDARYSLTTDDVIGGKYSVCPFKILTVPGTTPEDIEFGYPTVGTFLRRGKWAKSPYQYAFNDMHRTGSSTWGYTDVIGNYAYAFPIMDIKFSVKYGYRLELLIYPKGSGSTDEEIIYNGYPRDSELFEAVVPDAAGYYTIPKHTWFIFNLYKNDGDFYDEDEDNRDIYLESETVREELSNALIVTAAGQSIISRVVTAYHEKILSNIRNASVIRSDIMSEGDRMLEVGNPLFLKMSNLGEFSGTEWSVYTNAQKGLKTNTIEAYHYDIETVLFFDNCDREPDVYAGPYMLNMTKKSRTETFNGGYVFIIPASYYFSFGVYTNEQDASASVKPLPSVKVFSRSEWANYTSYKTLYNELKEYIDDKLYVPIAITSFTISPSAVEKGGSVNALTLNWATNITPKILIIRYQEYENGEVHAQSVNPGPQVTTYTFTDIEFTSDNPNFRLIAIDSKNHRAEETRTLSFCNSVYYGSAEEWTGISEMSSVVKSSRAGTYSFSCSENEYIWYAYPSSFGEATFSVGGFSGGFILYDTIDITNMSGHTESYYIYKSNNSGLEATVNVS